MELRSIILLIILIGANHAAGSSRIATVFQMLTNLQEHVTSLEEQQTEMRNFINKQTELTNQALTNMNSTLVECEGNDGHFFSSVRQFISEQISQYKLHKLEETHHTTTPTLSTTTLVPISELPTDCSFNRDMTQDSVQALNVGGKRIIVLCDTKGSIVLMKRYDGSVDFNKTLQQYSDGFGDLNGEFWTGLKYMHRITSSGHWKLIVDLEYDDENKRTSEYRGFSIGPGKDFTLNYDKYLVKSYFTAGDALWPHRGRGFTTYDRDLDGLSADNCAREFGGGWWFGSCFHGLLTGSPYGSDHAIRWISWKFKGLRAAKMSIKRN